ncbi:hypothetical protein BN7_3205 [Wickerhamomyces ciferrii]|uniref:25S rRNA (uridine-N(3))-methyltransferase BMT5-like domain-containing protein n=1 Tax=Wickerhamomyces ciferrii (strain ATCC 14091 / BCRC 22168 / CBS 111 / JCM 3599 / NBRC 0793 / NRRL Y-1031 F-60-10) TaxID=1206466 RepID=K0KN77_WICCF|nr:uncharacterized protein BN7_3205 [Wickerhamomyces ciferrii]CCH43652.1 hypothetical protein BN7_3205 [Wickerhamomyces ciferrii]
MARKLKGKPSKASQKHIKAAMFKEAVNRVQKPVTPKPQQQKKLQPKPKHEQPEQLNQAFIPFGPEDTVMLVGEGDFSFAASCLQQEYLQPSKLIITSFDNSANELALKYPHTFPKNNEYLKEKGVVIHYKIDGTDLVRSLKLKKHINSFPKLDFIVFNFPHTGRGMKDQDRNIRDHQLLVLGYFKSCVEVFKMLGWGTPKQRKSNLSEMNVLSTESQDKEPKIVLSVFEGEPYDSWNIKSLSKTLGLKVERSGAFRWDLFKGYEHKRTNSEQQTTKVANERKARIYVFEKFKKQIKKKKVDSDDED